MAKVTIIIKLWSWKIRLGAEFNENKYFKDLIKQIYITFFNNLWVQSSEVLFHTKNLIYYRHEFHKWEIN